MLKNSCIFVIIFISNLVFGQTTQWSVLWDLNSESDMYQYWVYRGQSPDPTNRIATVNHPADTYIDEQLQKGVLYYYRISAVDFFQNKSGYSVNVSAAIPKINFSSLGPQYISPGKTITIKDLSDYVTDPDQNGTHNWTANQTSLTITFNNDDAIIRAPESFSTSVNVLFTATDSDNYFDTASLTFLSDTSSAGGGTPDKEVFAYPTPINLAEDPNARVIFQNVPENATILIYNMLGELVAKIENVPYEWDVKNETNKIIYPGVYLYYVKSGNKKRSGKLVVVR
jgi:hypothetical protein